MIISYLGGKKIRILDLFTYALMHTTGDDDEMNVAVTYSIFLFHFRLPPPEL